MADIIPQTVLNKARKDKFILILDVPKVIKNSGVSNSSRSNTLVNLDKLQFSVVGTMVPRITVPAESVPQYGQTYRISSHSRPDYPPIKVGFKIDNNFDNYWVLWKWLATLNRIKESGSDPHFANFIKNPNKILDNVGNSASNVSNEFAGKPKYDNSTYTEFKPQFPLTDYQTTITVLGLREYNEKIVKFEYSNAFITDLGEISYDYKDTDEIDCSFEFVFNQLDISLIDPV